MWSDWWVWVVAGFLLAIIEVLVPGYIFIGFAIGSMLTGLLLWADVLGGEGGVAPLLLFYALASVAAWIGLRVIFGKPGERPKIWERDINDDQGPPAQ
ncbi:NfeD family protein [Pseudochelatococcus contaminans]|uniref:Membrane protein implicated in regulation of membrane protease activity n=1 Tax=Pseudochelatococcus contaminans TaxID=1538103 RepID=A0A7W5Z467_9HYPH|nr:hypothetical protein [Pseudochelatococcus contaminans]MBB3809266.1 membrane protein implicated in regulation of membrane protease activity [Pseudochelatococcus contaminans]